jgi:integrase/recombinase XerD
VPLVDDYLEFLAGRCRPNTVLAAAYDLRVFFTVVGKPAQAVRPADVLGFITAQRTGRNEGAFVQSVDAGEESNGVATSTVARRLSIISGFFAYLQARGQPWQLSSRPSQPIRRDRQLTSRWCAWRSSAA